MEWLTALLAFAVTMLMFAIVVSTFVEMIHRIWGMRAQGMRLMLESLYTKVIEDKLTNAKKPTAKVFAGIIMENRAAAARSGGWLAWFSGILDWLLSRRVVTKIPVEVFTQKLADKRIIGEAGTLADDVVKDISQQYVAFGNEISTYFERRARLFSVLVAVVVAWVFYIDPYQIADVYFKNPAIAQAVADLSDEAQADFKALQELSAKLAEAPQEGASPQQAEGLKKAIDDLVAKYADEQKKVARLEQLGVPIGWPDAAQKECSKATWAEDCTFELFRSQWKRPSVEHAFWFIVAGLLLGLGAPFWAQAVSYLTTSREMTKKISDIVSDTPFEGKGGVVTPEAVRPPATKATPVTTFKVAVEAKKRI